jgi:hypothetical protein
MGDINFQLQGHKYRKSQPVTITASAGIAGKKIKWTVQKVFPDRAPELLVEQDENFKSLSDMAQKLYSLVKSSVIPAQKDANRFQGIELAAPIVIGMKTEQFSNLASQITSEFPRRRLQKDKIAKDAVAEYLFEAVEKAYVDSGITDPNAYIARYSSVRLDQPNENDAVPNDKLIKFQKNVLRALGKISSNNDQSAFQSLKSLIEHIGSEFGTELARDLGKGRCDPNDVAIGNRFSSFQSGKLGKLLKTILRNFGLRKPFVQAVKKQLEISPNHVMCIKAIGEASDRPLTNIAEAMALQVLVNQGLLKIDEVRDPYA